MNKRQIMWLAMALANSAVLGSGFGLYEPSARFHAMGGAAVGKAVDASANFVNPATLTDLRQGEVTMGFVTEHPRGVVGVNGKEEKMDPGLFWLPHCMVAVPLPSDFTFGLGISAEYGLGTEYGRNWPMTWSCYETTVQGLVVNPNLAYKITDKWSVGAGFRWLYFDFEQYRDMDVLVNVPGLGPQIGTVNYKLKGDNEWKGFGWQLGTKYDILDNLSVGLCYKAQIETTIKGRTTARARGAGSQAEVGEGLAAGMTGDADADVTLPQSLTGGINWDPAKTWHLGLSLSWTQWSKFDELVFNIPQGDPNRKVASPTRLNWRDTWRASIGSGWEFAEDWEWMLAYTYDMDCTRKDQESAMLPPASRHILSTGFSWQFWENWTATLSYACIFMHGFDMKTENGKNPLDPNNPYELKTKHGFCHAAGFSITYRF